MTEIVEPADRQWLIDTHLKHIRMTRLQHSGEIIPDTGTSKLEPTDFATALLFGQEDSPTAIHLFKIDHYRCRPIVFKYDGHRLALVVNESRRSGRLRRKTPQEREAGCL